jgi:hypothetical protein
MAPDTHWDMSPRQSVERECAHRGEAEVVAACAGLLAGADADPMARRARRQACQRSRAALTGEGTATSA